MEGIFMDNIQVPAGLIEENYKAGVDCSIEAITKKIRGISVQIEMLLSAKDVLVSLKGDLIELKGRNKK